MGGRRAAAPFAFLGSAYDSVLKTVYAGGDAETLVEHPNPVDVLFGSGLFGNHRLRDLIDRHVDDKLLVAIAHEHAKAG